jgi:hypothetical protein
MSRKKLIFIFFLPLLIAVLALILTVEYSERKIELRLAEKVNDSAGIFSQIRELEDLKREDLARSISRSDLGFFLSFVKKSRTAIENISLASYQSSAEAGDRNSKDSLKKRRDFIEQEKQFLDSTIDALVGEWTSLFGSLKPEQAEEFLGENRKLLLNCSAVSYEQCVHDLAHNHIQKIPVIISEKENSATFVILTDEKFTGIAMSRKPYWSGEENMQQLFPSLKEKTLAKDFIIDRDAGKYFSVTTLPLFFKDQFLGMIIAGNETGEFLVQQEKKLIDCDITYVLDNIPVHSTIRDQNLSDFISKEAFFKNSRMVGTVIKPEGCFSKPYLKIILTLSKPSFYLHLHRLKNVLLIIFSAIFLISVLSVLIFVEQMNHPLKKIYQGIHEIINNNLDFSLGFHYREKILSRLAQSINLSVNVLLEKPLPEEIEEENSRKWERYLLKGTTVSPKEDQLKKETDKTEPSRTSQTITASQVMALQDETSPQEDSFTIEELSSLSDEVYYNDLFRKFINTRKKLSLPAEHINYIRFIQKLIKNEQALKRKHNARMVRFIVKVKDKDIARIRI